MITVDEQLSSKQGFTDLVENWAIRSEKHRRRFLIKSFLERLILRLEASVYFVDLARARSINPPQPPTRLLTRCVGDTPSELRNSRSRVALRELVKRVLPRLRVLWLYSFPQNLKCRKVCLSSLIHSDVSLQLNDLYASYRKNTARADKLQQIVFCFRDLWIT